MSFYQLCYTRTGSEQRNAGWNVTAMTPGISEEAVERFRSIAANIIRQKNSDKSLGEEILFWLSDDSYVYIGNAVMECSGGDGRGNSFVHGYIVVKSEYYQRCKMPDSMLGLKETIFIKNNCELVEERINRMDELPHNVWQRDVLLRECGIETFYRKLMRCVFSVLERKDASLFIKMREADCNKWKELCRKVIYCILLGLPYVLRPGLTFSSDNIGKGKIQFVSMISNRGSEFFDLENGEYFCELKCIQKYSYIDPCIFGNKVSDSAWKNTEVFLDQVFGASRCSNVTSRIIESVYLYYKQEPLKDASGQLSRFYKAGPVRCEKAERIVAYWERQIAEEEAEEVCFDDFHEEFETGSGKWPARIGKALKSILVGRAKNRKKHYKK